MIGARAAAPPGVGAIDALRALVRAELRSKGQFSPVGVLKWLLEPLSFMFIYLFLVGKVFDRGTRAFPLFLFCALVPWRYFTVAVIGAMNLVRAHRATITSRLLPRAVLPLVLMTAEGTTFLLTLLLFFPIMAFYGITPTIHLLLLPVVIAVLAVLTAGPAYLATVFGLYFPDFRGPAQNLIRAAFFLSAGLVPLAEVPGSFRVVMQANPLSGVFESFRAVFLFGTLPRTFDLLYPLGVGLALLVVGLALYRWRAPHFAKEV